MKPLYSFYKNHKADKEYWAETLDCIGEFLFSFDQVKVYNLFADYPDKLSKEEKEIFDRENPFWRDFFEDREG